MTELSKFAWTIPLMCNEIVRNVAELWFIFLHNMNINVIFIDASEYNTQR